MIVPTDEDIDSVISILGLDTRDRNVVSSALQVSAAGPEAGAWLVKRTGSHINRVQAKNNNIEQVVNEYFDNPSKVCSTHT